MKKGIQYYYVIFHDTHSHYKFVEIYGYGNSLNGLGRFIFGDNMCLSHFEFLKS